LVGRILILLPFLLWLVSPQIVGAHGSDRVPLKWWKGNLHTHSLWSDGDGFPELAADWYKSTGYHFLVFSEHNVLQQGTRWADANHSRLKGKTWKIALTKYRKRFGPDWVQEKNINGKQSVRIMPLSEY